jgi:hypothetical protein
LGGGEGDRLRGGDCAKISEDIGRKSDFEKDRKSEKKEI